MGFYGKRVLAKVLVVVMLVNVILFTTQDVTVQGADVYDQLRIKYKDMITGGSSYDVTDPNIASKLSKIESDAQGYWDSMDTSASRTFLWDDLDGFTNENHIREEYIRLLSMAKGYATYGSDLFNNTTLRDDLISALNWAYDNHFNETMTSFGNWYIWEISVPEKLNTIAVLLYDALTETELENYMNVIHHFQPTITQSGSNRVWECSIIAIRGVLIKDSDEIIKGRDGLSPVFDYVTSGDGFYTDGSFIQHSYFPYQGEYGRLLLNNTVGLVELLAGSSWDFTDPDKDNIIEWVKHSFAPLLYDGQLMSMVFGRTIAFVGSTDDSRNEHTIGHDVIRSILKISNFADDEDAELFKSMVKYWISADTYTDFFETSNLRSIVLANELMADTDIEPMTSSAYHKRYPMTDRVVHNRDEYALGLSMYSSRTANYESINNENLHGWYTNAGAMYLYNADQKQFSDNFWPTVDPYRIPGTTVSTKILSDAQNTRMRSGRRWVGGADIFGQYGVSGMQLSDVQSDLEAKKSWFMFDDEIVALGAGITSSEGNEIETVIENRKINGDNDVIVDGVKVPSTIGWSDSFDNANYVYLEGNTDSGSDIGYVFPEGADIHMQREERTGKWYDIYKNGVIDDYRMTEITRDYFTMWQEHGSNPTNETYSYVLLPNKSATDVEAYAENPDITILSNTSDLQGVRENVLGLTAVNFWLDTTQTVGGITSDSKASVMMSENQDNTLDVTVTDPTQVAGTMTTIEIDKAATGVITSSSGVTVTQLTPTIKMTVDVVGAKGADFSVKFDLDVTSGITSEIVSASADAYIRDGDYSQTNFGSDNKLMVKSINENEGYKRVAYIKFDLSDLGDGTTNKATLRCYVSETNTDPSREITLYGNEDTTWTESGITWENAPTADTEIEAFDVSNISDIWYEIDVTDYVVDHEDDASLSFAFINEDVASAKGNIAFASKESGMAAQLIIEQVETIGEE